MKSLVVEYMFDCYSDGQYRSTYDVVDGVSYTPRKVDSGSLAGSNEIDIDVQLDALVHQFNAVPQSQLDLPVSRQVVYVARKLKEISKNFEECTSRGLSASDGISALQFQTPCIFVKSADGIVEIVIVRSGNSEMEQTVGWKTRDNTARAGQHYVGAEGNISFQPGETQKVIQVLLLDDHEDNNINFKIDLIPSRFLNLGSVKTQNVNIIDYEDLSVRVKKTIQHIIRIKSPSIPDVIETFREKPSVETFKAALLLLCSNANSFPGELVAAFDLLKLALSYAPRDHLMPFITQYFEKSPELEQMDIVRESFGGMDIAREDSGSNRSGGNNSDSSLENSDLD